MVAVDSMTLGLGVIRFATNIFLRPFSLSFTVLDLTAQIGFADLDVVGELGEDVERHREPVARHRAAEGALVMTSRVSVDLVQKAATLGAAALIAPSAPTALAVAQARAAGLRLIARAPAQGALIDYTETP